MRKCRLYTIAWICFMGANVIFARQLDLSDFDTKENINATRGDKNMKIFVKANKEEPFEKKPAPKRAVRANEVYRNTNPMAFSKFLGDVSDRVESEYGDAYDIKGTRFVDDEVVIYELIVYDRYNSGEEISYLKIEQSADGFRVWREGDEETEIAVGKSFDDILEDCIDECGTIIEEVESTEY